MRVNLKCLARLAKSNPALARLCEISIYSVAYALIGAILGYINSGTPIDWPMIATQFLVPLSAFIGKHKRDLEKKKP